MSIDRDQQHRETHEADMDAETLLLRRECPDRTPTPILDNVWPVHPTAVWPKGLSLRREDIYREAPEPD